MSETAVVAIGARRTLRAPVAAVRVLEDRAFVRRAGELALEPGVARLRVDGVAPVLVDKTLEVRVHGARLAAARVRRAKIAKDEAAGEQAELRGRLEAMRRAHAERGVALEALDLELDTVRVARTLLLAELAEDVAFGQGARPTVTEELDAAVDREDELRCRRVELLAEHRRAERAIAELVAREEAARHPSGEHAAWVELDVEANEATTVRVELAYLVPSAAWRPRHRATLRGGTLELETEAFVWQRTGEDWSDVALAFSTERPSLGVEPPTLEADRLSARRKPERVEVETRQQVIATTGLGRGEVVAPEVPGVDDGGETQELVAEGRCRVPSDGRPHRTRLARVMSAAEVDRVLAAPSPFVLVRARATYPGPRPLLAGPVELHGEHGPVGESELRFVAPSDRFELGFGPEPAVRVVREEERLPAETKTLSSWTRRTTVVRNKLSHVGDQAVAFELVERIPVSEIADVRTEIDAEGTTPGATVDDDGFVRWLVELAPGSTRTVELRWVLASHERVQGI